jgi:hypothetical protein
MLPENNEENQSLQTHKLNLEAKYESLVILPEETTEKSCVSPCDNCVCNSESQNSDHVPPLEEHHSSPLKEDENKEISNENLTEKEFERENNEQLEEKEEEKEQEKEQLKENKNTNLEESKIDKELKNQKECIIV